MASCGHGLNSNRSAIPPRVVIIDDYSVLRAILRCFLEQHGFNVVGEGADGIEGLELASKCKPDLIVMDLSMPKMSGVEAASINSHSLPSVPIVAFTLYEDRHIGPPLSQAVSKNDGLHKLLGCIQSLLARPNPAREPATGAS